MSSWFAIGDGLRAHRPPRRRERGETLIEFALTLFLFLMMILGTAEFGLAVFRYNMLSNLAQEGARRAVVCGMTTGLPSADCNVPNFVQARSVGIPVTVTVTPSPSTLRAGDTVTVTVQHTFNPLTKIVPLGTVNLFSTARMIIAR